MPRIKIGVQLHPQHTSYAQYRDAWLRADELGVDSLWNWDHFFPLYGDQDDQHFEGWTLLAAMAAQTRRATVGCLVTCMSYRNPALLSNMAKTLDHVTGGGRFILGVGAGWFERDYTEYGYTFGTAADRLRNLEAGLQVIKQRWAKDEPPPLRGSVPILIGGGGEKVTLRITAQHADLWHGFGGPDEWGRKNDILTDWCRKVGRDPAAVERTCGAGQQTNERTWDGLVARGATHVIYGAGAPFDFTHVERLLRWREQYGD